MLNNYLTENILFIDVETVPLASDFETLDETSQSLWDKKSIYLREKEQTAADIYQRAGIYAEFGKIICISAGFVVKKDNERFFRIKSFYDDDEKTLLQDFGKALTSFFRSSGKFLCGHNVKEFDVPYIARRMLINGLSLPTVLNIAGKKPWEVEILDTMELWKFGDYKHYTSLNLLTNVMGIPSPKDDIDGSMVAQVYYQEKNLERIVKYCEKDVLATAQLFLRFKGEDLINHENIVNA
jgi:predicted PolB exonuclease-like 3'-5' exonuclease